MNVREKLLELLLDMPFGNSTEEAEQAHAENVADYLIDNGVTVQEWISVKDRLPDTCVRVLVHYDDGNILVDAIGSDGDWIDECFSCGYITHWMPLPQPPKGE